MRKNTQYAKVTIHLSKEDEKTLNFLMFETQESKSVVVKRAMTSFEEKLKREKKLGDR